MNPESMSELRFRGLDGSNPLAFLAALGTLRLLANALPDHEVRMRWTEFAGSWRPSIRTDKTVDENELLELLMERLVTGIEPSEDRRHRYLEIVRLRGELENEERKLEEKKAKKAEKEKSLEPLRAKLEKIIDVTIEDGYPHLAIGPNTTVPPNSFRAIEKQSFAAAIAGSQSFAEYVAAVGTSSFSRDDRISDTALRTMAGAGHQHFFVFMKNILSAITGEGLRKALFQEWRYDDPLKNLTMRWDPNDDARYALQWNDPSSDPSRAKSGNVLGANALAIAGFPMIPCIPTSTSLKTTGFTGRGASDTFWIWPIWTGWIGMDACRTLLAHRLVKQLHDANPRPAIRKELAVIGVACCYRSQRITIGKIRSFTPATAVMVAN